MPDPTDPRTPLRPKGTDPDAHRDPHNRQVPPEKRSNTSIALIVGGVVVVLLVLFMLFSPGRTPAPGTDIPAGDPATAPMDDPAAPAGDAAPATDPLDAPAGDPAEPTPPAAN